MVVGFLQHSEDVNGLMIKYEDLISGDVDLDKIESHLEIKIDRSLLKKKVGSSDREVEKAWMSLLEKYLLK